MDKSEGRQAGGFHSSKAGFALGCELSVIGGCVSRGTEESKKTLDLRPRSPGVKVNPPEAGKKSKPQRKIQKDLLTGGVQTLEDCGYIIVREKNQRGSIK